MTSIEEQARAKAAIAANEDGEQKPWLTPFLYSLPKVGLMLCGVVFLWALWQFSVNVLEMPPYVLPSPADVWGALRSGLAFPLDSPGGFYLPLAATLSNAALGFLIGSLAGIFLGSLMAEFETIETLLMPYAFALQALPKVAVAPLIVIWCGFGNSSKITMAALLVFFPLMVNTFAGMRAVNPAQIQLMRSLSASRLEIYRVVKLPAAAPYIFAGLDMGIVYALLGAIIAEFLGAQVGIGVSIIQAQAVSDVASVFAVLILLAVIGVALHLIIRFSERFVVHWVKR